MEPSLDSNIVRPYADMTKRRVRWGTVTLLIAALVAILIGVAFILGCFDSFRQHDVTYRPGSAPTSGVPGMSENPPRVVMTIVPASEITRFATDE